QELAIIDDLLSLMMRTNGRYMKFRHAPDSNVWREQLDVHEAVEVPQWMNAVLSEMARKIAPVAVLHMRIDRFVRVYARASAGVVNQALAAAIRALLKDYYVLVAQLEHRLRTATRTKPFTLQQVWFHVAPTLQVFERLALLIDRVQTQAQVSPQPADVPQEDDGFTTLADKRSNVPDEYESDEDEDSQEAEEETFHVRGGTTLNVISNLINHRGGDVSARQLYEFLLARATVPFLKMLRCWLHDGTLEKSQCGEFMVATEALNADDFLEVDTDAPRIPNFVPVPALTPIFLQEFNSQIVRTGLYLNIVRNCGVDLRKLDRALNGLLNQQRLVKEIEAAYLRANQALMDILLKDGHLFSYFGAVKHYLLFDKADYLGYFLDLARGELQKNVHMVSLNKLQSALELALLNPASISHDDPLRDHLRVVIENTPLTDLSKSTDKSGVSFMGASAAAEHGLIGAEVLALTLRVPFPYSIVLDAVSMRKYKELGRLLLAIRQTEQNLLDMWTRNRRYTTPSASDSAGQLRKFAFNRIYTVRHRMLVCVQQLLYYCCWEVIEPQWAGMM
ncbi:Spc97/Spc98, partial [Linderina pennispora]